MGKSILTGGIGASIFKVFQFSGVFRSESEKSLMKVLKNPEFLEKLKYDEVYQYWSVCSQALYNKKFSNISKRLQKIISEEYFPKHSKCCYESFKCEITILEIDDSSDYLTTEEKVTFIIHSGDKNSLEIPSKSSINVNETDVDATLEVKSLFAQRIAENGDWERHSFFKYQPESGDYKDNYPAKKGVETIIPLSGADKYKVYRKIIKHYPLTGNETKIFRFSTIASKAEVAIVLRKADHKKLDIRYERLGTINDFKDNPLEKEQINNCILFKEYNDLILPMQGFMFHIKRT